MERKGEKKEEQGLRMDGRDNRDDKDAEFEFLYEKLKMKRGLGKRHCRRC